MFTKADIEKYFLAEKSGAVIFLIAGGLAVIAALILYLYPRSNWTKGAAIPLVFIGIIQLSVGISVYKSADSRRLKQVYAYDMNTTSLKDTELPRVQQAGRTLIMLTIAEVLLLVAGVILYVYFKADAGKAFWAGLGIALAVEALICISLDALAIRRIRVYESGLIEFSKTKS